MCSCLIRFTSYKAGVLKIKIIEQTFLQENRFIALANFLCLELLMSLVFIVTDKRSTLLRMMKFYWINQCGAS